ncbi:MAG: DUF3494 domain-containing protein [Saprospiraceae bacterium]|nr:DUF3494 domain-containing protein [Saprospiraceae bacterium]
MRYTIFPFLFTALMVVPLSLSAQIGINTTTPDASAIVDIYSTTGGLLIPRLSTIQRNLIVSPASGLQIYNVTNQDVEVNTGTPAIPNWEGTKGSGGTAITSVTGTSEVSSESITDVIITGMTITPPAGTYLVLFNGQYERAASESVSTSQAVIDLQAIYDQLIAFPVTHPSHAAVFGNGETITPGVYFLAGAISLAATLILDGQNDPNALFIIHTGGAFTSGAGTMVSLINGANANNIFWVSEGASSLAANTTMKGTMLAHNAAISVAAGSDMEGRLFSTTGAVAFGPGIVYIPTGISIIEHGVLSSFVIFTSLGAISNTEPSDITGDVGTNGGAISGFENIDGNVYGPGQAPPPPPNTQITFSIYQNDILIAVSSRTGDVNSSLIALQSMSTVEEGQTVDVRWKVDEGPVTMSNRILTLVKAD